MRFLQGRVTGTCTTPRASMEEEHRQTAYMHAIKHLEMPAAFARHRVIPDQRLCSEGTGILSMSMRGVTARQAEALSRMYLFSSFYRVYGSRILRNWRPTSTIDFSIGKRSADEP